MRATSNEPKQMEPNEKVIALLNDPHVGFLGKNSVPDKK